jgi:hypothetical protein
MSEDAKLVLHEPFTGINPKLGDTEMSLDERSNLCRTVLQQSLEIPYKLEVFQGELLYEVTQGKYWKEWEFDNDGFTRHYESFEEYVEQELGFKRRKAYDLIDIYRTFVVDLALPPAKLGNISWSKARLVTKIVDKDNADEILDKIEDMTVREVKEMAKDLRDDPLSSSTSSSVEESLVRVTFQLAPAQAENLHNAIAIAQTISGSEKPSHNMDLICTDFLASASTGGIEGALAKLETVKSSVERAFGVKLEIKEMDEERFARIESGETVVAEVI